MTCCACRSYASTLSAILAEARTAEDVVAAARDVWWKQVQRLLLLSPDQLTSRMCGCLAGATAWHCGMRA